MWDFQGWVSSLRREPYSENFPECLLALSHWRDSTVFIIGVPFGTVITRQNSDNRWFVDGVGAVFMGEAPGPLGSVVRKYKLPGADCSFSGFEVLFFFFWVFFSAAFENLSCLGLDRQYNGNTYKWSWSHSLCDFAKSQPDSTYHVIKWDTHSRCFEHQFGSALLRGNYRVLTLHPEIVHHLWERFGQASADLFTSCKKITMTSVLFSSDGAVTVYDFNSSLLA